MTARPGAIETNRRTTPAFHRSPPAAGGGSAAADRGPTGLPGIGERRAEAYAAAGLTTRRELLYHLPSRYRSRPVPIPLTELRDGERAAIVGRVERTSVRRRGRRSTVSLRLVDDGGRPALVLLFNRAYLAKGLRGARIWAAGRVEADGEGPPRLLAADYERLGDDEDVPRPSLLPIYRLPAGIPPRVHRKALAAILAEAHIADWREPLPDEPSLGAALAALHDPVDTDSVRAARRRLARDEAFALSLDVAGKRRESVSGDAPALVIDEVLHRRLLERLPHVPTAAQERALADVRADLGGERPMARLLQGDVGSGKTLVALYALLAAVEAGRQGAIMAPTEVLAHQHAATLRELVRSAWGDDGPRVALVVGGGSAAERRREREAVSLGLAPLVVGTHGLQSKTLEFADLAVGIVDEQHRFGVRQRVRFRTKGHQSHLLVMTATPIPRTLALTAYGELDVTVLDELPPGRAPRRTHYVARAKQPAMWRHLADAVADGERGYVVCPSIAGGSDDESESHSVAETLELVRERLGDDVRVESVHGRLPAPERDAVLDGFRRGDVDVLVATVLIEVGLDVPEASFVVVPDPSRFGLATLHQIRGRVGRGERAGSCYLLGPLKKGHATDRVKALVGSDDGFVLAEEDLRLRGPGELLGTRQSGMPGFLVLDPVGDVELLAETRGAALEIAKDLPPDELAALRERAFPRTQLKTENLLAGG